jgi:hypothetical protein
MIEEKLKGGFKAGSEFLEWKMHTQLSLDGPNSLPKLLCQRSSELSRISDGQRLVSGEIFLQ